MNTMKREPKPQGTDILGVLTGLLIGSLAGAVATLLLAPHSGEETRIHIQEKGFEIRERMNGTLNELLTLSRYDNRQIPARLRYAPA